MADYNASVALGINAPDPQGGLNTLNKIMELGQRGLSIQGQKSENVTKANQAQQSTIETQRQQGLQSFFQQWDPSQHDGPDGTTDMESARKSDAYKNAGLAKPDIDLKLAQIKQAQLNNKQSLTTLNGENLAQFGRIAQALKDDPDVQEDKTDPVTGVNAGRAKVDAAFKNFSQLGPDAARVAQIFSPVTQHAPPGKLVTGIKSLAAQSQDVSAQQAQTNPVPTSFDTGEAILPATIRKDTGIPTLTGQSIKKVTPPQITTNATGQLVRVAPGGAGASVVPTAAAPGAPAGQPAPNANPTTAQAIGQRGQAEAVSQRVAQVQAQADSTIQAQDALSRARAIVEGGESPDTGNGFENKRAIANFLSNAGFDTKASDNMNTLSKNLARYEASRATAIGLGGTDAARELAHSGSPNTQLDNKALQGIIRQSLATEKILAGYANVQSKTNDPQQQLQNEVALRSISHPIETMEYTMSRNKTEAEQYLKEHGLTHQDIAKSIAQMKQFGLM